jgi:hypothetical protein
VVEALQPDAGYEIARGNRGCRHVPRGEGDSGSDARSRRAYPGAVAPLAEAGGRAGPWSAERIPDATRSVARRQGSGSVTALPDDPPRRIRIASK